MRWVHAWPHFTGKEAEAQRAYLTRWVHTFGYGRANSPQTVGIPEPAVNDCVNDGKLPPLMTVSVAANCNTLCERCFILTPRFSFL